ncbi:type II secretion system F family protein [Kroppenstedtia eburnea]|uniref:Type II secretion system protein F (GspF) n=1 Tax=Kroppenstedtia eburnea TaxID=714067 RepID=A0A1N7J7M5_9BACL|nr:type II secretion system F family protein [Kroppenstedtia eburnea]QKI82582.1 type II secretion system F family protein [Kroppenstedtia eburnea]SIS45322.1 type II secretion system protein F (GspF) [Kroppenstedtia eburnea]
MSKKGRRKWNADRLTLFSQHLANLLEAGFPLVPSIRLLSEQGVIGTGEAERILGSLDQGKSLSAALEAEGMPALFTSLIRAAEEHGDYGFGLKQCEVYYRERGRLIRELTRALTYPMVVLMLVGLAFLFLMTTVVPRFSEMYETMGLTLPLYTRIFLRIHQSLQAGLFGLTAALLLFGLICLYIRRLPPEQRRRWTSPLYSLPVVRSFFALRFTHYLGIQLGSLLKSGLPLLKAVEVMDSLAPWDPFRRGIFRVREQLLAGESLHRALEREEKLFLPSLPGLVALGEETGALDRSLLSLAQGTELMIKERLDRLTHSLEPILIFLIGMMMAATVLALFLPMLHLVEAI